jgi:aspartate/methionine/tyrosine aminotransferase
MKKLAERISQIIPSASMAMAEKIMSGGQDRKIIDLTWGQPDFDTPEHIKQAAFDAIRSGKNGYTNSYGIAELRSAIAEAHASRYKALYDPQKEVLVTPGAKQGLMYLIQTLIDPGDEVILFEPCWLSYRDMVLLNGGKPRFIPAREDLTPDLSLLEKNVGPGTKAILLNNPVNPSGYVFKPSELEFIAGVARKNDLYIISDEIYDRIVFTRFTSFSEFADIRERLFIANGFSKAYAMTGWRIGYLLGPGEIISKVGLIHQHTATCAAAPSQYAAVAALKGSQEFVDSMCLTYRKRRDFVVDGLRDTAFGLMVPDGTFYAMLNVSGLDEPAGENGERLLNDYGIATVNGVSYGQSAGAFVRLSLTKDLPELAEMIERLGGRHG